MNTSRLNVVLASILLMSRIDHANATRYVNPWWLPRDVPISVLVSSSDAVVLVRIVTGAIDTDRRDERKFSCGVVYEAEVVSFDDAYSSDPKRIRLAAYAPSLKLGGEYIVFLNNKMNVLRGRASTHHGDEVDIDRAEHYCGKTLPADYVLNVHGYDYFELSSEAFDHYHRRAVVLPDFVKLTEGDPPVFKFRKQWWYESPRPEFSNVTADSNKRYMLLDDFVRTYLQPSSK